MTLRILADGDRGWDIAALGRLDELSGAESVEWHSPDRRERPLFERSRAGLRFVDAPRPDCGVAHKLMPLINAETPPPKPLGRFLVPDPKRVSAYRAALPPGPLAGLVWGRKRRVPLEEFAPLAALGYTFMCPQFGAKPEELEQLRTLGLSVARPDDYDPALSLDDEAALMEACDFVVTPIESEAYVAAALGKPTYVLSYGRGKTPMLEWFASVTVLEPATEPQPSKWAPMVADLCSRLAA